MFTFVVWCIGLAILAGMALANMAILIATFERSKTLGVFLTVASFICWPILLAVIFF
jgi:hypothetical protein